MVGDGTRSSVAPGLPVSHHTRNHRLRTFLPLDDATDGKLNMKLPRSGIGRSIGLLGEDFPSCIPFRLTYTCARITYPTPTRLDVFSTKFERIGFCHMRLRLENICASSGRRNKSGIRDYHSLPESRRIRLTSPISSSFVF